MTSRATIFLNFVRYSSHSRRKVRWTDPAPVQCGLIKYYPRHPNEVDPVFQPSKLFFVKLVKPFWGNPWWEKNVLKSLGFDKEKKAPVIVKNTPNMCASLWKVKHLLEIVPIKLPEKMPTADDINNTYLHENGTFTFIPKINPDRLEVTEKFMNDPKKLDREYIQDKLRRKWLDGRCDVY